MNLFDILIGSLLVLSVFVGWARGALREVLSLAGWVTSLWLAVTYAPHFSPFLERYVESGFWRNALTTFLIFLLAIAFLTVLFEGLIRALKASPFRGVDRVLGLLFGAARAGVLLALALFLVKAFDAQLLENPVVKEARTRPWLEKSLSLFEASLPAHWLGWLKEQVEKVKNRENQAPSEALKMVTEDKAKTQEASEKEPEKAPEKTEVKKGEPKAPPKKPV